MLLVKHGANFTEVTRETFSWFWAVLGANGLVCVNGVILHVVAKVCEIKCSRTFHIQLFAYSSCAGHAAC